MTGVICPDNKRKGLFHKVSGAISKWVTNCSDWKMWAVWSI